MSFCALTNRSLCKCSSFFFKSSLRAVTSRPSERNFLFKWTPQKVHPYLELARLDTPTGTWLVYLPSTWSIALAAAPGTLPSISMLALFGVGSILMRGAGCTINDMLDRDIDTMVFRTANRPLARGAVSMFEALAFLGLQLFGALFILLQLNTESILIGSSCLGLVFTYPLFKRFTYWPQLMLGLTLNWGALLGYTAVNSFSFTICLPLYMCGVCQTIMFDSIYSHQDIKYDISLGLKSTAILFGDDTKKWLSMFTVGMTTGLATVGVASDAGMLYFAGTGLTMARLAYALYTTDLKNPASCFSFFRLNKYIGMGIFGSIVIDNLFQITPSFLSGIL